MKRTLLCSLTVAIAALVAWLAWPAGGSVPGPVAPGPDLTLPPPRAEAALGETAVAASSSALDPSAARVELPGAATSSPAPAAPAALTVAVATRDGVPAADVAVVVTAATATDPWADRRTARTDAAGEATFALPAGAYECRTSAGGAVGCDLAAGERRRLTLLLPPAGTLCGRIVDVRGAPVADAEVVLLQQDDVRIGEVAGRTDRDGAFSIGHVAGPRYVAARHAAFAPAAPVFAHVPEAGEVRVRLVLHEARGHLEGRVVAALDGRPVEGALLLFGTDREQPFAGGSSQAFPPLPALVRSDAEGRFRTPPLAPGPIAVRVQGSGFGTFSGPTEVVAGRTGDLLVRLEPGAVVRGVVRDANGAPAAGVLVHAGPRRGFGSRSTHTLGDGSFRLADLPAGAVPLGAVAGDGSKASTELQLAPGAEVVWLATLATAHGSVLAGRILDDLERPLAGWIVTATDLATSAMVADAADARGEFELDGVRPLARLRVTARPAGAPGSGFPAVVRDDVVHDGTRLELRAGDPRRTTGAIAGAVRGPDAMPRSATVEIWHDGLRVFARYPVGSDGELRVAGVPAGALQITVVHPDHPRRRLDPCTLAAGTELHLGEIRLEEGAHVFGTLLGPDGLPPADATIRMLQGGRDLGKAVYAAGTFRSPPLPAGLYTMLVQGDRVAPGRFDVELAAGESRPIEVRLETGYLRRIRVVAPANAATGGWTSLHLRRGDEGIWSAGQPLGAQADFDAWLSPGEYEVVAVAGNGYRARGRLHCSANGLGADPPLVLTLAR